MKLYALTGGIGAGKTAASQYFASHGIPVIDSDALGHLVIQPEGPAFQAVIDRFGEGILSDDHIHRPRLGEIVFADPQALKDLNAIIHPAVHEESARLTHDYVKRGHDRVIVEAALHAENGILREEFEGLILVHCPVDIRIQRLIDNRGMDKEEALARIENQTSPERKLSLAKWILHNDKDLDHLHAQIDAVIAEL
jgi:dephospho-CoA kinase